MDAWTKAIAQQLHTFLVLPPGWDGYDAPPVTQENVDFALSILESLKGSDHASLQMLQPVPGTNGSLQLEWHTAQGAVELYIVAPHHVYAWHADSTTSRDGEEVVLTTDFTCVRQWLRAIME